MNINEFKKYANSFQSIAKLRLESITLLMNEFNNIQDELKFIHVAGTNGKGSVCTFIQNILTNSGYKTGKYISPNMVKVNERISVDGIEISDEDLSELLDIVNVKATRVKEKTGEIPTQFEIWTATAFLYFKKMNCDYVVLETGLGGNMDATNVIKNPIATIITKIALDHVEYLGDTLEKISTEKAGIIKESIYGGCTITCNQEENVLKILKEKALSKNNKFIISEYPQNQLYKDNTEIFDYSDLKNIKMKMIGKHQSENASMAIELAKYLDINIDSIYNGIYNSKNPGRFDVISENPLILFDGAHNTNGMTTLVSNLKRCFNDKEISFVVGFMKDKDIDSCISLLKEFGFINSKIYTVTVKDNPRAIDSCKLSEKFKLYGFNSSPCNNIIDAINLSYTTGNMTVICGSLYLYKDYFDGL